MDNLELLLHASFSPVNEFVPRVPDGRAPGEDSKTPRICFSTKLENAISSMPGGGLALRGLLKLVPKIAPVIHVYYCLTWENAGVRFVPPAEVQRNYHVPDAIHCGEWWALDTPKMIHKLVKIKSADFEDGIDPNGSKGVLVKNLDYEVVKRPPTNMPDTFFNHYSFKDYTLRQILAYAGEREDAACSPK